MKMSERLEQYIGGYEERRLREDQKLEKRIISLLEYDAEELILVDLCYFDGAQLPEDTNGNPIHSRDAYLLYGINKKGKFISRWIDRWDLWTCGPVEKI